MTREGLQRHRLGEPAHATQSHGMHGVRVIDRYQRALVDQPERVSRRLPHATPGSVGIRVAHPQGAAGTVQAVHQRTAESEAGNLVHGTEEQRMVGDEQVRAPVDRLIDDGARGIGGEGDARDLPTQIAHDQPRFVPAFRIPQRIQGVQYVNRPLEIHIRASFRHSTARPDMPVNGPRVANRHRYLWRHPAERRDGRRFASRCGRVRSPVALRPAPPRPPVRHGSAG